MPGKLVISFDREKRLNLTLRDILDGSYQHHVIFRCIAGSHMYNTAHADSDQDIRGIFVLPESAYLSLLEVPSQVNDDKHDTVFYSLRRFVELAMAMNPNIIELLYAPEDCIQKSTPVFEQLQLHRNLFVSKQCFQSHVGYAQAQIQKARGRNKWVNNPQPEPAPEKQDYCWIIPITTQDIPFRPIPLCNTDIRLEECHCSALEHCSNLFRLYHYGQHAKGVFRGDQPVCESIPYDDESKRCVGLLIYNQPAYERALKDHHHYWQWRRERNDARWQSQEAGDMDYDAKNMMHTFRLLMSGIHLIEHGEPKVRFMDDSQAFLLDILRGAYAYDDLILRVQEHLHRFEQLREHSQLPDHVDHLAINQLLKDLTQQWEQEQHA